MKRKRTWLITDTHLGHAKMVEYCGRPVDHSERILRNLKTTIKPGDTLIHLGDVCFGKDAYWHSELMGALYGVWRILVLGNHDNKTVTWYKNHGWDEVFKNLDRNVRLGVDGDEEVGVHLSHHPLDDRKTHRRGKFNIHGHFHNNDHRMLEDEKKFYDPKYHKLIAIENTDLLPVNIEDYVSSLKAE